LCEWLQRTNTYFTYYSTRAARREVLVEVDFAENEVSGCVGILGGKVLLPQFGEFGSVHGHSFILTEKIKILKDKFILGVEFY